MRRRLLTIAIFLLAGGVVNVGVAWGCAVFVDPDPRNVKYNEWHVGVIVTKDSQWQVARFARPGRALYVTHWSREGRLLIPFARGPNPATIAPAWGGLAVPSPEFQGALPVGSEKVIERRDDYGFGWPMLSLWHEWSGTVWSGTITHAPSGVQIRNGPSRVLPSQGGFIAITTPSQPRALPLRPIWPGFVVNTVFYAALLWLLIPGPFALRRFLRVRRGVCPRCAYPMGESDTCSECGKALPKRAVA